MNEVPDNGYEYYDLLLKTMDQKIEPNSEEQDKAFSEWLASEMYDQDGNSFTEDKE